MSASRSRRYRPSLLVGLPSEDLLVAAKVGDRKVRLISWSLFHPRTRSSSTWQRRRPVGMRSAADDSGTASSTGSKVGGRLVGGRVCRVETRVRHALPCPRANTAMKSGRTVWLRGESARPSQPSHERRHAASVVKGVAGDDRVDRMPVSRSLCLRPTAHCRGRPCCGQRSRIATSVGWPRRLQQ